MKYNIYAGLGGSFGGATYRGTGDFKSRETAEQAAYEAAVEEYEMYEGSHGILDWNDVAENNNLDPDDENNESEIDEFYRVAYLYDQTNAYYIVLHLQIYLHQGQTHVQMLGSCHSCRYDRRG